MRFLYYIGFDAQVGHTHRRERGKKPNKRRGKDWKGKRERGNQRNMYYIQLLTNFVATQKR